MVDPKDDIEDEGYFDEPRESRGINPELFREPLSAIPTREAVVFSPDRTVTEAMRAMQREHRGCVLITDDGTQTSKVIGIFTERDVLFRIVDKGRNPATLPIGDVMTPDPETLPVKSTVAYALNMMSVGGFRHIPVVDDEHRPAFVVSVRDVVEYIVSVFPREVLNLPTDLGQRSPSAREGA